MKNTTQNIGNMKQLHITPPQHLKILLMLFVLFSSQIEITFAQVYDAPGVEWNKYHYPTRKLNGTAQTAAQSGEDWYYDVKPVYQSGTQIGYICAGYTSFANENNPNETCNNMGNGLGTNPDLKNMEYCNYRKGADYAKLVFVEMDGNVKGYNGTSEWYKIYGTSGSEQGFNSRFYGVTPTSDGGYIAVGSIRVTNGFKYNPTPSNPTGSNLVCNTDTAFSNLSNYRRDRFYVVKVNSTGATQWQYIYGFVDNLNDAAVLSSIGFDVMQKSNGNYILVGMSDVFTTGTTKRERLFSLELNSSGQIVNKFITSNVNDANLGSGHNRLRALTYKASTNEYFAAGYAYYGTPPGTKNSDILVVKISGTNSFFTGINTVTPSGATNFNAAVDIEYNATLDRLLLPAITNISGTDGGIGGENPYGSGIGKIQRIRTNTLTQDAIYDFGNIKAYDLWMGIINLSGGGFAVVSTKQNQNSNYFKNDFAPFPLPINNPIYSTCTVDTATYDGAFTDATNPKFNKNFWGTAAIIKRYNNSGTVLWEKIVEESTPNASLGGNIGQPDKHGDLKRQECFYKIAQTQDGGLVICGNNSNNFDDDALIKLYNECQANLVYNSGVDIGWFNSNNPNKTSDYSVTGNITWSASKKIDCIIRIKAGGTLNITGTNTKIEFTDTKKVGRPSKIIVEPGGKLFINGATLTGIESCNSMWEGIEVWGLGFYDQSNLANQGYVELSNNATIKNARVAINVGQRDYVSNNQWAGIDYSKDPVDAPNYFLSGGKVVANSSNFLNNKVGVRFQPYVLYNNTSYFSNTLFENNAYLLGEKNPDGTATVPASTQAWIINNDGIKFNACTFQNTISGLALDKRGMGIYAQDADFQVLPVCTAFFYGACFGYNKSKFNNFNDAIVALASPNSFTGLLKVDMAEFNNNVTGVRLFGTNQATQITNNIINIPNFNWAHGIYMFGSTQNFTIENNTISGVNAMNSFGILTIESGHAENRIYRNTFNSASYATWAFGNNSELSSSNSDANPGLQYKCNKYLNSTHDIVVADWAYGGGANPSNPSRIKRKQGDCPTQQTPSYQTFPAGNVFDNSSNCGGAECHILLGTYSPLIRYHYHNNDVASKYEPINITAPKVQKINCFYPVTNYNDACPSNFSGGGGGGGQQGFAMMQQNDDEVDDLEKNIAQLYSKIDGGNTQYLLGLIADNRISGSQLKDELMNVGSYLSDEVLIAAILRATPLAFADLKAIVLNNAPVSEKVFATLETARPAVAYHHQVADAQQNETSAREQLYGTISILNAERADKLRKVALHFTEQDSLEALVDYLLAKNEKPLALPYLIKSGRYSEAYDALNLFDLAQPGNADYVWLQQLHIELLQKEKQWNELDSLQLERVVEIANNLNIATGQAQSILTNYYGYQFDLLRPELPKSQESLKREKQPEKKPVFFADTETKFTLYPNPASNFMYVKLNAVYEHNITMEVYDIKGQMILKQTIVAGTDVSEINTENLTSGNYISRFYNKDEIIENIKFTIVKKQ